MLNQDPTARITAVQALKHRFFADNYLSNPPGAPGGMDTAAVAKLRSFANAPAMRRLAVLVEAHLLGPEDDETIRKQVSGALWCRGGGEGIACRGGGQQGTRMRSLWEGGRVLV